ncbi:MAG: GntR family transcriptional regulator [Ruthenibacterium sp.]
MHLTQRQANETGRDYALRTLKDNIIWLALAPGSMVSEKELSAEMGLSRTPVREALIELAKVKIVEIYPQRGSSISLVDYDLFEEARFMRETLECAVVERCCVRGMTQEQTALLQENIKLQEFYLQERNNDKLLELDNEFHRALFVLANLPQVHMLMDSMTIHLDRVRGMSLLVQEKPSTVADHRRVLEAITAGELHTAAACMHEHLCRSQVDKAAIVKKYPQYIKL